MHDIEIVEKFLVGAELLKAGDYVTDQTKAGALRPLPLGNVVPARRP